MFTIDLEMPDIKRQSKKMDEFERNYQRLALNLAGDGSKLAKIGWQRVAARDTGAYIRNIADEVRIPASGIIQGSVSTTITSPKGFPYPRALEESDRYHYRKHRFSGRRTAGAVSGMFRRLKPVIVDMFKKMGDELTRLLRV